MSTEDARAQLVAFLQSAFEPDEWLSLLQFQLGPGGREVARFLEDSQPNPVEVVDRFLLNLESKGLLSAPFWSLWEQKVNLRVLEIRRARRRYEQDGALDEARSLLLECYDLTGLESDFGLTLDFEPAYEDAVRRGLFLKAVRRLSGRGLIDERFWRVLEQERDRRVEDVRRLRGVWMGPERGAREA